jgi:hypothetical protein
MNWSRFIVYKIEWNTFIVFAVCTRLSTFHMYPDYILKMQGMGLLWHYQVLTENDSFLYQLSNMALASTYCHVSGYPWQIMNALWLKRSCFIGWLLYNYTSNHYSCAGITSSLWCDLTSLSVFWVLSSDTDWLAWAFWADCLQLSAPTLTEFSILPYLVSSPWSRFFVYQIADTLSKGSLYSTQYWLAYLLLLELNNSVSLA